MADIGSVAIADRKRFATCYQHITDKAAIDWAEASAAYDPKVKLASFKTVTSRALKALDTATEIKEGDLNRFALCYVYATDKQAVDWPAAAKAYDSKVKVESFKTVVGRALRKHNYVEATPKAMKKRKVEDLEEAEGTEVVKKPRKALKTLAKPKAKKEPEVEDINEPEIKPEQEPVYEHWE